MFVDLVVGDIASATARNKDFDADFFGAIEEKDVGGFGVLACGFEGLGDGDGGHEP